MSSLLKIAEDAKSKNTCKEDILYQEFQGLRLQQRHLATRLSDYEIEDNELKIVMKALNEVEPDRKCFRLIGGILYEKTVKDVLPALEKRRNELQSLTEETKKQLADKANEMEKFRGEYKNKLQPDSMLLKSEKLLEAEEPQAGTSQ